MSGVLLYNIRFWCPGSPFGSLFIWGSVQIVPFFFFFHQASVIPPLLSLGDLFIFVCSFLIIWNFQRWRNWISRGNNQWVICKQEFVTWQEPHLSDKAIFEIFHVGNIHYFNFLQNAPHKHETSAETYLQQKRQILIARLSDIRGFCQWSYILGVVSICFGIHPCLVTFITHCRTSPGYSNMRCISSL